MATDSSPPSGSSVLASRSDRTSNGHCDRESDRFAIWNRLCNLHGNIEFLQLIQFVFSIGNLLLHRGMCIDSQRFDDDLELMFLCLHHNLGLLRNRQCDYDRDWRGLFCQHMLVYRCYLWLDPEPDLLDKKFLNKQLEYPATINKQLEYAVTINNQLEHPATINKQLDENFNPTSVVDIYTCVEEAAFGHTSCTGTFEFATASTFTKPPDASFTSCGSWNPPISGFPKNPHNGDSKCVIDVKKNVPQSWPSKIGDAPVSYFSPFDPNEVIAVAGKFCAALRSQKIKLVPHVGECKRYSENQFRVAQEQTGPASQYSLKGRNITIGLAFDQDTCSVEVNAIDFATYPASRCQSTFSEVILQRCMLADKDVKQMNLDKFTCVGGVAWLDCMRWTIVAIDDLKAPDDTLYGQPW
ncbi:hypothetical protein LTR47_001351 [Exophiala xenobiotica]|nr:hypothetical protein LTR72_004822 [Exophiala xenobiotica]KAK5237087.1 hypothetical protein LTR47_001351 [Exophiala xenobiotica]KAK5249159.1 hypothetical protein LTS06_005958 [Exophiala xenobiotica]KAK5294124.1 hypothetical protein LTR14_005017 [Exophiala xenobiotica]KAK5355035.1 hypothetical protein LTR61_002337 [Exophiala xenobiotica]